jgi:hypothetical protein
MPPNNDGLVKGMTTTEPCLNYGNQKEEQVNGTSDSNLLATC